MFSESPGGRTGRLGAGLWHLLLWGSLSLRSPLGSEANQGHVQPAELVWATFVIFRPLAGLVLPARTSVILPELGPAQPHSPRG